VSVTALLAAACITVAPFQVVERDGQYRAPDSSSRCLRLFHGEAEATYLEILPSAGGKPSAVPRAIDITAFAWIDAQRIVFSSSPIYGEGGLWLYDLRNRRIEEIGPSDSPAALEYLWTELVSVTADTVTIRIGGRESLDRATAPQRTFRWVVRPRPLRAHN
jgi:hypothetical protein